MKLKDICTVFVDGDWIESKDQSDSGIRLIQTGNVGVGEYCEKADRAKYISEETFKRLGCTEVFSGDILVSRLPDPIGRACIIPKKKERMITAVDCTICRPDSQYVIKEYLCYFMRSEVYYHRLMNNVTGTTRKRISRGNLGNVEIELPSISRQMEAVEKLDSILRVIEMRKSELTYLDELIKARFVEMFGDPYSNPKEWQRLSFKEAGERLSDGPFGSNLKSEHYTDSGIRVIRLGNIGVGKFIDSDKSFVSEEHYLRLKKYTCKSGDIVIGTLGEPNLRACRIPQEVGIAINKADCVHYVPKKELLNNDFVCQYINCPETLLLAGGMIHGQTRSRVSSGQIAQMPIFVPPICLQNDYSRFVAEVDKSKVAIQKSLDELVTLFESLMKEFFV